MNNLKSIRKRKNLTQSMVASQIGISYQSLGLYENEKCQPAPDILCKLADFYEVSVDYLLARETEDGINYPKRYIEADEQEQEVLRKYRVASASIKEAIGILLMSQQGR